MARESAEDLESWNSFLVDTEFPWCWWCGRGVEHFVGIDASFPLFVQRAHVVSKPRRRDRRAAVLLCSLCHHVEHNGSLCLSGFEALTSPLLAHKLWLKKVFDVRYFSLSFLQANMVGKLPGALVKPPPEVVSEYQVRRGNYPL